MEQNYKLEIVGRLALKHWHVRGLAKELGVNPMLLSRKFKELYDENVLDFREEGKNKIYFLKNTSEARNYIFMAENYKLIQLLKRYPNLRGVVEKIKDDKRFDLAVLFGSYAKGLANKNSDIDVYIKTEEKNVKKELESFNSKLSIKIGKFDKNNLLGREIEKNHVIIKGVERFYENY